jgi:hypothetical protein
MLRMNDRKVPHLKAAACGTGHTFDETRSYRVVLKSRNRSNNQAGVGLSAGSGAISRWRFAGRLSSSL